MPHAPWTPKLRAALLGVFVASAGCATHSRVIIYAPDAPPAPLAEVITVAPGEGYGWIAGHHSWQGGAYVWVNAIEDGKPSAQPRAFQLPYSKDVHALLNEGMKKIREGVSQMGSSEPKRGRGGLSWLRPGSDEQTVKLRDLPVPQLPEK